MEYNTTLRINDRLFYDIQEYCDRNDLDMREYLVELIEAHHMINKYGDLNELMPKVVEESKVTVKKRGRPKKKVEEENKLVDIPAYKSIDEQSEEIIVKTEECQRELQQKMSDVTEVKQKPTVKRKRTLKTL